MDREKLVEDMLREYWADPDLRATPPLRIAMTAALAVAEAAIRADEREQCAQVADDYDGDSMFYVAASIRARGDAP